MSPENPNIRETSLEQLKVSQVLQDLRTEVAIGGERIKVLTDRVDSQISVMRLSVERHEHLLVGNGNVGIVVRLDRVEQTVAAVKWLWGLIIPLSFTQIYQLLFKR